MKFGNTETLKTFLFGKSCDLKVVLGIFLGFLICSSVSSANYDFIIVGGGTAGLAVARRLAEGRKYTVLVLEYGGFPKKGQSIPALAPKFLGDPDVTFKYSSTPQKHIGLKNNGIVNIICGKMLSGTSNLNYMVFNRGHPKDFDNWAALTGDNSWTYSNILKYFKRAETYTGDYRTDQHGYTGPIRLCNPKWAPGLEQWLQSGKLLGYPVTDPMGPQQRSFSPFLFAKRYGRRDSAFTAYIQPIIEGTPNLQIFLRTNVTRIIFKGNRAIGVEFESNAPELRGVTENILYANKEVILSAGAYGSPLLLLRSGIGPKDVLEPAGIPQVHELPVGRNYLDHVVLPMPVVINNQSLVMDDDRDLTEDAWEYFNVHGDGPYSSTQGLTGQAFIVSSVAKSAGEGDWPDVQIAMSHGVGAFFAPGLHTKSSANIAPDEAPMAVILALARPKSIGTLSLNASNPFGPPVLDVGYLSDQRDRDAYLDGVKEAIRIFEQEPYQKIGARFPPVDIPLCREFTWGTDDYWRCYISCVAIPGSHPGGTCKMGRASDPDAVVDTRLRVIGISGLRVVDTSIMPVLVNANTMGPVYGIAEKASDMILSDWHHENAHSTHPTH